MSSVVQRMRARPARSTRSNPLPPSPPPLPPSPVDAEMVEVFAPPSAPPAEVPKARAAPGRRNDGRVLTAKDDPSPGVFDILNIFRRQWFLSRSHLLANVLSAQKSEDGLISWVEFSPPFHSHLVKCALALVPRPVPRVKRVMFVFILELLNQEGHLAFFDLQKGGRKANNAQKEKRRLARKRSRAAKREREREAAKAAKLPPRERSCLVCGRQFQSRKTAKRHKCARHSKVVRKVEAAAAGSSSHPAPPALEAPPPIPVALPPAPLTPLAPPAPSHNGAAPPVTGDSGVASWPRSFHPPPPSLLYDPVEQLTFPQLFQARALFRRPLNLPEGFPWKERRAAIEAGLKNRMYEGTLGPEGDGDRASKRRRQ